MVRLENVNIVIGVKFNKLTVYEEINQNTKTQNTIWKCKCDCGNFKNVSKRNLINNRVKSCGCLHSKYNNPKITSARRIFKYYRDGNLTFDEFIILSQYNCFYCGSPPSNKNNSAKDDKKSSKYAKENGDFIYNGLDRIDSSKLHNKDNVVPCCKQCNVSKRERSFEVYINWIEKLYKNLINKKIF